MDNEFNKDCNGEYHAEPTLQDEYIFSHCQSIRTSNCTKEIIIG